MARGPINAIVTDVIQAPDRPSHRFQRSVKNATVQIYEEGTTTPVSVYDASVGGSLLSAPFKTDSYGRVVHEDSDDLYAITQNVTVVATKGLATWTLRVPIMSAEDVGGRQLAYAQAHLPSFQIGASSSTPVDVTGLVTGDFEVGLRPIRVEVDAAGTYCSAADGTGAIRVLDTVNALVRAQWWFSAPFSNGFAPFAGARTLSSLDPGTYNFKVQIYRFSASGTVYITSFDDGTPEDNEGQPASIRVVEG